MRRPSTGVPVVVVAAWRVIYMSLDMYNAEQILVVDRRHQPLDFHLDADIKTMILRVMSRVRIQKGATAGGASRVEMSSGMSTGTTRLKCRVGFVGKKPMKSTNANSCQTI